MDNASNNFTAVKSIVKRVNIAKIHPIEVSRGNMPALTPDSKFIQCHAFVLSLVVKILLQGKKTSLLVTREEKKIMERKVGFETLEKNCSIGEIERFDNLDLRKTTTKNEF